MDSASGLEPIAPRCVRQPSPRPPHRAPQPSRRGDDRGGDPLPPHFPKAGQCGFCYPWQTHDCASFAAARQPPAAQPPAVEFWAARRRSFVEADRQYRRSPCAPPPPPVSRTTDQHPAAPAYWYQEQHLRPHPAGTCHQPPLPYQVDQDACPRAQSSPSGLRYRLAAPDHGPSSEEVQSSASAITPIAGSWQWPVDGGRPDGHGRSELPESPHAPLLPPPLPPPPPPVSQYAAFAPCLTQPLYSPPFYSLMQEDVGASIQIFLRKKTGGVTSILEGNNHRLVMYDGFAYDILLTWNLWSPPQTMGRGIYGRIYYAAVGANAPMYDLFSARWFHWRDAASVAAEHGHSTWCRSCIFALDLTSKRSADSSKASSCRSGMPRSDDLGPAPGEPPVANTAYYRIEFGIADSREDALAATGKSKLPVVYREFVVQMHSTAYRHRKTRKRSAIDWKPLATAVAEGPEER